MAVEGSTPQLGVIVPHLVVRNTAEALSFHERAFGATILYRSPSPSGDGEHLHLRFWDSLVQVSSEEPAQQQRRLEGALLAAPESLGGSTCVFRWQSPTWMRLTREPSINVEAQPCLPRRCSGVTDMAGSAIPLAIYGHLTKCRKYSRPKKSIGVCVISQQR